MSRRDFGTGRVKKETEKENFMKKEGKIVKRGKWFLLLMCFVLCIGVLEVQAKDAKHIILVIGDGMNIEHEIATSRYLYGQDFELSFHKMLYKGNVSTWDVTAYNKWAGALVPPKPVYDPNAITPRVGYDPAKGGKLPYPLGPELPGAEAYLKFASTDSASAATAWATGYKTDNGNLAWLPGDPDVGGNRNNDGSLKTIAEWLREKKGYAIGMVSTVPFTHATPAAHVSHNKSRNCYTSTSFGCTKFIDWEILTEVKPEVVIGGGHPSLNGYGYISQTLYENFKNGIYNPEYVFVERIAGMDGGVSVLEAAQTVAENIKSGVGPTKLFGLYGGMGGNFESLKPYDLPGTPVVKQATSENPTFTEASLAALKVLSQDPNGFFVMLEQGDIDWANHDNDFQRMVGTTKDLDDAVQAIIDYVNQPGDAMDWTNTLLIVTADHSNSYTRLAKKLGAGDLPNQEAKSAGYVCPAGTYCGKFIYPDGDVTYGSGDHTNELVRLYAFGAGTLNFLKYEGDWYPGTRILDNTHIFHVMMDAAGESVRSPLRVIS
jgi:alkaline phosphatase